MTTRTAKQRKAEAAPGTPLAARLSEYVTALKVRDFSEHTIRNRESHIKFFLAWCAERGLTEPTEVTRPVLESFQRRLFHYRKRDGEPMSFRSQHVRLVALRCWFRWLTRQNLILHNPASEIELPRLGRRLPKHVLTIPEVEQVLQQPDIADPLGLRDRAILEVLYSCGIRRAEVIHLNLFDLDAERGTLLIRQGKGKKDRFVPIGERAIAWVEKYIREARPQLVVEPDMGTLFPTGAGEEISPDHLTLTVGSYVQKANLGKTGACHLFRHTMATLMLEGGADIRFIQQMLGHAELSTTEIYTHVSIRMLKQVHTATHPAAALDLESTQPTTAADADAQEELFAALDAEAEEEHEEE
ncbi:MAG TPA: site-specific tyrosine recombinase XerC [Candidatus Polarisedimenticolia bacterium]|nr:site-specific tyrosine recombinase XerC [Candidatus Polarisedimenticolia bacterium]